MEAVSSGHHETLSCELHVQSILTCTVCVTPSKGNPRAQSTGLCCQHVVNFLNGFFSSIPKFSVKVTKMAALHIPD